MNQMELKVGDVVQLNEHVAYKFYKGAFMVVTELKTWGAQGDIHALDRGAAFYRATWEEMEFIGHAALLPRDPVVQEQD